jgi:hypothetical protein
LLNEYEKDGLNFARFPLQALYLLQVIGIVTGESLDHVFQVDIHVAFGVPC